MNLSHLKILLQYSVTVTNAYSRKLLINAASLKKSKKIPSTFARIYCTRSSNETEHSFESDADDEFDMFEDDTSNYMKTDFEAIAGNDQEKIKKLKLFQLEIDLLAQQGEKVPTMIKPKHWNELLLMGSKSQRYKYFNYLWTIQMKNENAQKKRKVIQEELLKVRSERQKEKFSEVETDSPVRYGLSFNTLFHRIYPSQINHLYNWKLTQASIFGPDMIVDCGYEEFMCRREISLCAKQIMYLFSENRENFNPFNLIFCNYNRNGLLSERLLGIFPNLYDEAFPFVYTEKHYLDLFPRKKLIYLSPHCNDTMETYEPGSVYIIGAIVDKIKTEPVSLAKGKKDGLRMAKFPLDKYLNWGYGVKSLTLNQCLGIVTDLKDGSDWNFAFRHVPKRKLANYEIPPEQLEQRSHRFTAKNVREQYRRNLVYELLLKEKKS